MTLSTDLRRQANDTPKSIIAYPLHGNCYLNITNRCTLRCGFCPKHNQTWEVRDYDLLLRREPSVEEILDAVNEPADYKEIVFCGLGEPTTRLPEMLEVARRLKEQGARIRVNTDGLANLRSGHDVTVELAKVVDALSISMNAHDAEVYETHCRPKRPGAFASMLDFARLSRERGMEVTLSAVDGLQGVDIEACRRIARDLGVNFRRRVLNVVG